MAIYLITGIAGFIGSALAHALLEQGHQVRGLDNLSSGSLDNLRDIEDEVELWRGDVCDPEAVRRAVKGADFVLHHAAVASVPYSLEEPLATHCTNVNGTLNVLLAARDANVRRVIFAASSSAYGDGPDLRKHEGLCPRPLSPYAAQKLAGELYMSAFYRSYGLETVCLRYFNIYGPRQSANSPYSGVIARFLSMMLKGERPQIFGDGEQSRDFTYVEDAVAANLLACQAPAAEVAGRIMNIGSGQSYTLNYLYATLASALNSLQSASYAPGRDGDIQHSHADITLARALMGYEPRVSLAEGLARTADWYREAAVSGLQDVPARGLSYSAGLLTAR